MATVTPNQYLHDIAVQYQVYLERLKTGEAAKFDRTLVELDRALRQVIQAQGDGKLRNISQAKFERLMRDALKATDKHAQLFAGDLMKDLRAVAEYAAHFEAESLTRGLVKKVAERIKRTSAAKAWQFAKEKPIQATGELLESFIKNWRGSLLSKVEGVLRNGYAQGKTTGQLIVQLRGTKANGYKDGILTGQTRRQTAAMVRTAVQHASSQGRQATWSENDDLVDGYVWVSTLDNRTTQVCRSLDGRFFKLNEGPVPPIHIGCRSVTVAHIKGVNVFAFTQRASKGAKGGAQVPATMTYYEWLKTQPSAFQDDALGPERGRLLREGGLSAERFAELSLDKNFQPLTLEQMREKAPGAFKRAGL